MVRRDNLTRREVSSLIGSGVLIALAGCSDDDEDESENGTDADPDANGDEDADEASLVVFLEDEDGESVSDDLIVEIIDMDESLRYVVDDEIEDGVAEPEFIEAGSYTVVADGDDYESPEEEVTLEAGDEKEITLELEASS